MGYFQPLVIYRNPNESRENSIVKYIGNRVKRKNKNFLCAVVGSTGCLDKDTILLGQTKTLEELYKSGNIFIDTYSLNKAKNISGTYYPIKSKSQIIPSGKKEVYEIELENGKKVIATSEHKFFKQNKNIFEEIELKYLNVGDRLRDLPVEYINNFYDHAKKRSRDIVSKNFNHKKKCIRCDSLFYIEKSVGKSSTKYCKSCKELLNNRGKLKKCNRNVWYEWEDNILRNYYYDSEKEFLLNLISNRTWSGIEHRASRKLKLKRNPKFNRKNDFTSEKNPMFKEDIRLKVKLKLMGNKPWNKGISQWKDKEHPKGMLGKHHSDKTKEDISISTSGEKNVHWLGGKSFEPYDKRFNKLLKRYIKKRDDNKCSVCSSANNLNIHHIDYNKLNSDETNCIALCCSCHSKTNFNRDSWIIYFNTLINNRYLRCTQQK